MVCPLAVYAVGAILPVKLDFVYTVSAYKHRLHNRCTLIIKCFYETMIANIVFTMTLVCEIV